MKPEALEHLAEIVAALNDEGALDRTHLRAIEALVADIAPPEARGAAFGLRQSLDTVGAFLGPLLAVGLMLLWKNDFRAVFWFAAIPAVYFYNHFIAEVKSLTAVMDDFALEFLNIAERNFT